MIEMSTNDRATASPAGFAERIWPVIDVHARVRRLVEADERRRLAAAAITEALPAIA
jgi:hypothetical protein